MDDYLHSINVDKLGVWKYRSHRGGIYHYSLNEAIPLPNHQTGYNLYFHQDGRSMEIKSQGLGNGIPDKTIVRIDYQGMMKMSVLLNEMDKLGIKR